MDCANDLLTHFDWLNVVGWPPGWPGPAWTCQASRSKRRQERKEEPPKTDEATNLPAEGGPHKTILSSGEL